ncbi:MAG: REP element-mobilizing transposase RayT [Oleispira sp.]|jgi:REP element-mobilizing transposase RayT
MMPKPRKTLIAVESTPYYHCVARCVRRAFLCGVDTLTGQNYEHRRAWLEDRLLELPKVFAIDIAAYAIMSNHYHVILHINTDRAKSWSDYEVVERWHQLFNGTVLSQKYLKNEGDLSKVEMLVFQKTIDEWRSRLLDISWFMRILNEAVAREANAEDGCTGRFWEGRFKSQALLDEAALMACMAYVDLNPIRAKMATTPEQSDHTSIKKRCEKAVESSNPNHVNQQEKSLYPFVGNPKQGQPEGIQMKLSDYLELVDSTGRVLRKDKRGAISASAEKILDRLDVDEDQWLEMTSNFEGCFSSFVGGERSLRMACENLHYQRPPGLATCKLMFH